MSTPKKKTHPRVRVMHMQSLSSKEKGICRKRGDRTRRVDDVTCPECMSMLHRANRSEVLGVMARMAAGAKAGSQ